MMKCGNCSEVFDDEDVRVCREDMGEHFGTPCYELSECCPCCGSDDIADAEQCTICGEYFDRYELENNACDKCQANTKMKLRKIIEANFTGEEINIIRELQEVV